ncbi:hypothetical protein BpHYR1_012097 [Brachionus plicatilis]|uniref:Uncharacterized protein n=1 Tax=Brachionus plicatilis TaxID=10195 RepID=A0A3M7R3N9_BRAPC|nr:hypothetical protein BpHYR1_012097 [Brachionus plicatilis]
MYLDSKPLLYSSTSLTVNETEWLSPALTYLSLNSKSRFETVSSLSLIYASLKRTAEFWITSNLLILVSERDLLPYVALDCAVQTNVLPLKWSKNNKTNWSFKYSYSSFISSKSGFSLRIALNARVKINDDDRLSNGFEIQNIIKNRFKYYSSHQLMFYQNDCDFNSSENESDLEQAVVEQEPLSNSVIKKAYVAEVTVEGTVEDTVEATVDLPRKRGRPKKSST